MKMKSIGCLSLLLVMVGGVAACHREKTNESERILLQEARVTPGVGVTGLKLGMTAGEVAQRFGVPQIRTNGGKQELVYSDLGVAAQLQGGVGIADIKLLENEPVVAIVCGDLGGKERFLGKTTLEVGIGNSRELVEKLYGKDGVKDRYSVDYPKLGIRFGIQDERVVRITVYPAQGK